MRVQFPEHLVAGIKRRNYVMQSRPKILTILRLGASSTLLALLRSELRAPVDSLNHPDHSLEFCLESSQIKGIRQHVRHLTTGTSLESHTQEAGEAILLVDEVDVFFGEDCCIDVTCCVRLQSGSPEHPVAAVRTELVFIARCVSTREGEIRVSGMCLAQAPIPLPALATLQNYSLGWVLCPAIGSNVDDSRSRGQIYSFPVWALRRAA